MTSVVCVLRSGGDYTPQHVRNLYTNVRQHVQGALTFWCFTDLWREVQQECPGVAIEELRKGWPGWWSKLEVFRLMRHAVYMDLDTVIVRDITDIVRHPMERGTFITLRDLGVTPRNARMGSGLMMWNRNMQDLYTEFRLDPQAHMNSNRTSTHWGDQGFIQKYYEGTHHYFQDVFPGKVQSWKLDILPRNKLGDDTSIVCFHGKPRPWQITEEQKCLLMPS